MDNLVMIKSNQYGISVILDEQAEFELLLKEVAVKFRKSASFFKDAQMAVSFEGRRLSKSEEQELVNTISNNCRINIVCLVDQDKEKEEVFKSKIEEKVKNTAISGGQFYKGTLRSGQLLEAETSIIVLGDVNSDANIVSAGNIIVLGSLKGMAYAGGNGNTGAFVVALDMDPMQIRIGDVIARSSDKMDKRVRRNKLKKEHSKMEPQIAFVEDGNIYIEPITRDVLNDLPL